MLTRRKIKLLEGLKNMGVTTTDDNCKAIRDAEIVIIAVQPSQLALLLKEIKSHLNPQKHIVVSIVTGVSLSVIQKIIGTRITLLRAMPNTAIAIQNSITCIASQNADEFHKIKVLAIFEKLGKAIFIEEELMSSATVLGACGIAYAMRYIRAASQGGIEIGFDAETAQLIAAQTIKGAPSLLLTHGKHPESEIDKVTTPRGCTIAGLNEMEHQGFSSALIKGILTSHKKINHILES